MNKCRTFLNDVQAPKGIPMRRYVPFCLLVIMLISGGCFFAAKQAAQTARGGHGEYMVIEQVYNLADYDHIAFESFDNDIGSHLSKDLQQEVNNAVKLELQDNGILGNQGRVLQMMGKVIHLEKFPIRKKIVVRVHLKDGSTGKSVGTANVIGAVEGARGYPAAASGVAFGMSKLLADNHFPGISSPLIHK